MTRLFAAMIALVLAMPALAQQPQPQPKETPAEAAAKLLNGTYSVKEINFDNKPAPEELVKGIAKVEIKDGAIVVFLPMKKEDVVKFVAQPQKDAKTSADIDLTTAAGKMKPGKYKLDKGELTLVFSDTANRPADLNAAEGVRRMVLTRQAEPKKEEPKKEEPKKDGQ